MLDLLRGSRISGFVRWRCGAGVMWSQVELVGGASDAGRPLVEDMGVDLRRADVAVAEELLHRADVAAGLEQVRGEGMPQGVARGGLWDFGAPDSVLHGALEHGLVEVVAAALTGLPVHVDACGREPHCQAHSRPALGYLRASAHGSS